MQRTTSLTLYDRLFQDTEDHNIIMRRVSELTIIAPYAEKLLKAIKENDYESPVFLNKQVDLYLLFLIKEKKLHENPELNFYSGMTFYFYMMTLKEYPNQKMYYQADHIRGSSKMLSFNEHGELSSIGQYYLDHLKISLKLFEIELDLDKLKSYILQLPLCEQSLLVISDFVDHEHRIMGSHLPLINPEWHTNAADTYDFSVIKTLYIPAFSIFNYLLKAISGQDLSLEFHLGFIDIDAAENLAVAKKNKAYVPLYSSLMTNDQDSRDFHRCFIMLRSVKYLVFAFTRSAINKKDILFTFNQYLPYLSFLQKIAIENNDEEFSQQLQTNIDHCANFLVSPLNQSRNYKRIFSEFLEKNLKTNVNSTKTKISLLMKNIILCVYGFLCSNNTHHEREVWLNLLISQINIFSQSLPSSMGIGCDLIKAILYLANNNCYTPQAFMILTDEGKSTSYTGGALGVLHFFTQKKEMNTDSALKLIQTSNIPKYLQEILQDNKNLLLLSKIDYISSLNSSAKLLCQFTVFQRERVELESELNSQANHGVRFA